MIIIYANHSIHYWNLQDGQNLLSFTPQLFSTALASLYSNSISQKRVTTVLQDMMFNTNTNLATGGMKGKKMNKILLLGTESGHICTYYEKDAYIDSIPVAFLRASDFEQQEKDKSGSHLHSSMEHTSIVSATSAVGPHHSHHSSSTSTSHTHHHHIHVANDPILWMKVLPDTNQLLVSYSSGKVIIWDLNTDHMISSMKIKFGAILNAMKNKSSITSGATMLPNNTANKGPSLAAAAMKVIDINKTVNALATAATAGGASASPAPDKAAPKDEGTNERAKTPTNT